MVPAAWVFLAPEGFPVRESERKPRRTSLGGCLMGGIRSCVLAFALSLAVGGTLARAALIDSNLAASAAAHVNGGGCYPVSIAPGLLDMLTLVNPEWAPVDPGTHLPPLADPVTMHGTVALSHINEAGDFSADHASDDQNTNITLDAA